MNAVIYCRVSSKEQVDGTSLDSQQLACEEYSHKKGFTIVRVFVERGESAKYADRTELVALLDYCKEKKHRVGALIVWKVDRFARNVADHFSIKAELERYGVSIHSVTEPIEATAEGKLMETILAGFAQFDNDIRTARSVQGMRRKIQEGIYPWKPPLGYRSVRSGKDKKTEPDIPDQPAFSLLRRGWQLAASGTISQAKLQRILNSSGLLTRRGKPITRQALYDIFTNPFYAGLLVDPWSGKTFKGQHVALVSVEEFERAEAFLTHKGRGIPHLRERDDFPLRGFVRCPTCAHVLTGSLSRGRSKQYPYYRCNNADCSFKTKSLPASKVEDEFTSFLANVTPSKHRFGLLRDYMLTQAAERTSAERASRRDHASRLRALDNELLEAGRMRAKGLVDDGEFSRLRSDLLGRKANLLAAMDEPVSTVQEIDRCWGELTDVLCALVQTWDTLRAPFRNRFQLIVLPDGYQYSAIGTAKTASTFRVSRTFSATEADKVALTGADANQICIELQRFAMLFREVREGREVPRRVVRRKKKRVTSPDKLEPGRRYPLF